MRAWPAALYLENGHLFQGSGFGALKTSGGEAVFNTGITGYQEIFTDPSYCKQILVMTNPHIGNTGINFEDTESSNLELAGIVMREICEEPSNWRAKLSLSEYLHKAGIPGIAQVDTRELTQVLRNEGAQRAIIFSTEGISQELMKKRATELLQDIPSMQGLELVSQVSTKEVYDFHLREENLPEGKRRVVVYDYGVKHNILRHLRRRGYRVTVVPYNTSAADVLKLVPSGVVLSNGPGDPEAVQGVADIQNLIGKVPILAICMGHQLLARALGCKTYKLKFGHHGVNHPVKDLLTGKISITSQNHGFAVSASEIQRLKDVRLSHINLNDQTAEGFVSEKMRFYSVQFHPEASPGPSDANYIFDSFLRGFVQ